MTNNYSYPQKLLRGIVLKFGAESLGFKSTDLLRQVMRPVYAAEMPIDPKRDTVSYDQERYERVSLSSSWVFSNIDAIAKEASTSRIQVFTLEGEKRRPIIDHPFELVMRRPNPWMGSSFLKRYTATWQLLRGEAYWMLVPNKMGELAEIWPLPSNRVFPVPDPTGYISGFGYKDDTGNIKFLLPENVCYIREPNPFNYHRGLSKLAAYILPMLTDLEALRWNKDTFSNEAALKTLISLPADMQQANFETIREEIIREIINGKKRYMITRAGDVTAKTLGLSQREMEFLEGRAFTREEIDRVFGIPAAFWDKNATEANAKIAREIFTSIAVWPMMILQAEEMESQILRRWYETDETEIVQYQDIRPKNRDQDAKDEERRIQSMTVNEVREMRGQGEHPNELYGSLAWTLRTSVRSLRLFDGLEAPNVSAVPNLAAADERPNDKITPGEETANIEANEANAASGIAEEGKGAYVDLRRWRSIAAREIRNDGKATYRFKSDFVEPRDLALAYTILQFSKTEEASKAFFGHFWDTLESLKAAHVVEIADPDLDPQLEDYQTQFDDLVQQAASGNIERSNFEIELAVLLVAFLIAAYEQGGGENPDDNEELQIEITQSRDAVGAYADDIYSGLYSADNDQTAEEGFDRTRSRTSLWIYAMAGAYAIGKLYGIVSERLLWSRGATKEPCFTCLALDNVVRTKAEWILSRYRPQARNGTLDCGGFYCQCRFISTDDPVSGDLP